jgi:hypothetical protein
MKKNISIIITVCLLLASSMPPVYASETRTTGNNEQQYSDQTKEKPYRQRNQTARQDALVQELREIKNIMLIQCIILPVASKIAEFFVAASIRYR